MANIRAGIIALSLILTPFVIITMERNTINLSSSSIKPYTPSSRPVALEQEKPRVSPIFTDPNLKTFGDALKTAELTDLFQGTGPFTSFVPTNEAFKKLGDKKLQALFKKENRDELTSLLIYHIAQGKYLAENLKTMSLKTINGKNLNIVVEQNGDITVNNAKVIKRNLIGPNGVTHVIDTVLIP